jgi:hypothetical protein
MKYNTVKQYATYIDDRMHNYNSTFDITFLKADTNNDIKDIYNNIFINTQFFEEASRCNMTYYLKNIMQDMGYTIVDATDNTSYKLIKNIELMEEVSKQRMDKFFANEELKTKIIRRMNIIKILFEEYDEFAKNIVFNDKKFMNYLNIKKLLNNNMMDNISNIYSNDFNQTLLENINTQIIYFKMIVEVLKIKDYIGFDYDIDREHFDKQIKNKNYWIH